MSSGNRQSQKAAAIQRGRNKTASQQDTEATENDGLRQKQRHRQSPQTDGHERGTGRHVLNGRPGLEIIPQMSALRQSISKSVLPAFTHCEEASEPSII